MRELPVYVHDRLDRQLLDDGLRPLLRSFEAPWIAA